MKDVPFCFSGGSTEIARWLGSKTCQFSVRTAFKAKHIGTCAFLSGG